MSTPVEKAVAFKNEGNKAFAAHDWVKAIDLYTKAIELDDKQPTYYSNRAQVNSSYYPSAVTRGTKIRRQTSSPRLTGTQ